MNDKLNSNLAQEDDSCEGMGAVLWIIASLAVIAITALSLIAMSI